MTKRQPPHTGHQPQRAKPPWLKRRLPSGPQYEQTRTLLHSGHLHTVCQEANCPNMFECFSRHTATFLILGDRCTRDCAFCAVQHGPQEPPDADEPQRVAEAAADMKLSYVVVTSVTRDDLTDGGASLFAETITRLRDRIPGVRIEVLIPDFQGNAQALQAVLEAGPDVLNHNIETVARLYGTVRPQADYRQSLHLLERVYRYAPHIPTKSGLMVGLGESDDEIRQTLRDLRNVNCRILTLGQYLRPGKHHHDVMRYVSPEAFDRWREEALRMGFAEVASGPFVRSSYNAAEIFNRLPSGCPQ
jgi:lipoyl synthase